MTGAAQPGGGGARPRIDFVSPLPPVRSGIADYSRDLLPHLEPLCDLRVVRVPEQPVAAEIAERWRPVDAAEAGRGGRLPLYQMGNNRYHEGVLRMALERPGVVTLHDVVLHHLLIESTLAREDFEGYRERLAADHGWVGEMVARARAWGEVGDAALFSLPAHRTLVRRQRGVLVHSRWAADLIREENPDVRVRPVPMGVPLPPPVSAAAGRALRERLGIAADRPLLGSFGFQTPIKRTLTAIGALASPRLADAHLLVAGEVSPALDFERRAREAGVADRVHVTGFLDYEEFEAAIAASDVCLNLRYPTAGETSASLLRVLAVGRPTVVSDYAQFAELPDEVAVKAPLGEGEEEALAGLLAELLADRGRLAAMAAAARDYVARRHDPAAAAAAVAAACGELAEAEPPGAAPLAPPPPTTLTWLELAGEIEVEGAGDGWGEGEARRLEIALSNTGFSRWLATRNETGGVLVEVQWRRRLDEPALAREWRDLPRDVAPGETFHLSIETRRPLEAGVLIVEPHVIGAGGFGGLGGPVWISDV